MTTCDRPVVGLLPDVPAVHVLVIAAATGFIWLGSGWLEAAAETVGATSVLRGV